MFVAPKAERQAIQRLRFGALPGVWHAPVDRQGYCWPLDASRHPPRCILFIGLAKF
jgi:hypothetical protein